MKWFLQNFCCGKTVEQSYNGLNSHLMISREIRHDRTKICDSCEKLTQLKMCSVCNCFMPWKTYLKDATCPENKW
jgi:hypothetical protein